MMEGTEQSGCPNLLTSRDVATLLGVAVKTLSDWRSKGKGPSYIHLSGNIRYHPIEIADYLAANTVKPTIPVLSSLSQVESGPNRRIRKDSENQGKNRAAADKPAPKRVKRQKLRRKKKSG